MKHKEKSLFKPPATTKVATLEKVIKGIAPALKKGAAIGLVYVDFSRSCRAEDQFCWESVDQLFINTVGDLLHLKEKDIPYLDVLPAGPVRGDDFIVFFVPKASSHLRWTEGLLSKMSNTLREGLLENAKNHTEGSADGSLDFFLGSSAITPVNGFSMHKLIYRAIREAADITCEQRFSEVSRLTSDLERIIGRGEFTTVFQPVIHLKSKAILGYEALARGPAGTRFNDPEVIFDIASRGRFLLKAERLAKISAMEAARDIPDQYKLFLNIESELLIKPEELMMMLREVGCRPGRIVFEITERKAVKDFDQLHRIVKLMKDEGYQFAIDDAGSGYASMESIAILDPHYIKIDQSMIRGIDASFVKQDVVRAFVNLSKMRHATLIAEGVEEEGEYQMLSSLGVEYAQGFFFARPAFPPPNLGVRC